MANWLARLMPQKITDEAPSYAEQQFLRFDDYTFNSSYHGYRALASNAVLACVIVRARTMSTLPARVYKTVNGYSESDSSHALNKLISNRGRWNPLMSAVEGKTWISIRRDCFGDAFVRVQYNKMGSPVALWHVTCNVKISLVNGKAVYQLTGDKLNPAGEYQEHEILHFKSVVAQDDGFYGTSLVSLAHRTVGLSIQLEEFYQRLITNGTHFGGNLVTDAVLKQEDVRFLQEQMDKRGGVNKAGKPLVLDKGLKWQQNDMTVAEADVIKQQTLVLQSTCRVFSVQPQKIFDLSTSTYSNVEQGDIAWAKDCILPECVAYEGTWQRVIDYMGSHDSFVRYELNGLMRGDYASRMDGHAKAIQSGLLSINQAAALEDLPPIPGGDQKQIALAQGFIGPDGSIISSKNDPKATAEALLPLVADARERIQARLDKDGDTVRTAEFADMVIAPLLAATELLGIKLDSSVTYEQIRNSHGRKN